MKKRDLINQLNYECAASDDLRRGLDHYIGCSSRQAKAIARLRNEKVQFLAEIADFKKAISEFEVCVAKLDEKIHKQVKRTNELEGYVEDRDKEIHDQVKKIEEVTERMKYAQDLATRRFELVHRLGKLNTKQGDLIDNQAEKIEEITKRMKYAQNLASERAESMQRLGKLNTKQGDLIDDQAGEMVELEKNNDWLRKALDAARGGSVG